LEANDDVVYVDGHGAESFIGASFAPAFFVTQDDL
jgi:glycosylphosphatidylinositol transamidase (GPIT) subunit GPI8